MAGDISKKVLYESVKTLLDLTPEENDGNLHISLSQQKLFTLFSIGFQYMLFCSTKRPGSYIIRVEDNYLADKLSKRAKDPSTRKFLQSLLLPRKFIYQRSTFYLDFFHFGSWNLTNEIPKHKVKGALIVKNTSKLPMNGEILEEEEKLEVDNGPLPPNFHLTSLQEFVPNIVAIAFQEDLNGFNPVNFSFIDRREKEKTVNGVTLGDGLDWEEFDK